MNMNTHTSYHILFWQIRFAIKLKMRTEMKWNEGNNNNNNNKYQMVNIKCTSSTQVGKFQFQIACMQKKSQDLLCSCWKSQKIVCLSVCIIIISKKGKEMGDSVMRASEAEAEGGAERYISRIWIQCMLNVQQSALSRLWNGQLMNEARKRDSGSVSPTFGQPSISVAQHGLCMIKMDCLMRIVQLAAMQNDDGFG